MMRLCEMVGCDASWRLARMMMAVGAFATILDAQNRALLCHRRDGDFWWQPGGGVERGETPWQAVVREAREETGLVVRVERLIGVYCWPATGDLIFSFHCVVTGGALAADAESDERRDLRSFPLDALPPNTFAEHAERLRDAVAAICPGSHQRTPAIPTLLRTPSGPPAPEELRRAQAERREGEQYGAR